MATSTVPTKADLQQALDHVVDVLEEALDPRLSREEVVEKLADLHDELAPDQDDEDDDDTEEEEE